MKKYQTGGSTRGVMSALRNINIQQQSGRQMGDIWTGRVMGEAKEDLQEKIEAWQKKMEKQQKKSGKLFKALKFLDFIPGGKWVKAAIGGVASFSEADKMKKLLSTAGGSFGGFKKSFLGSQATDVEKSFKDMSKDINPLEALMKSVVGSVISNKAGETFKEAFGGAKVADTPGGSKFTGDPLTTKIDIAGKPGGVGFKPDMSVPELGIPDARFMDIASGVPELDSVIPSGEAGGLFQKGIMDDMSTDTPWKDQFLGQFGFDADKGEGFKNLFSNLDEGTGMKFLSQMGLVPGEEGLFNSPIFNESTSEKAFNQFGGGDDIDLQSIFNLARGRRS